MRIVVIDPITAAPESLKKTAEYFTTMADAGTEVEVVGLRRGPKKVGTFHNAAYAVPEILRLVREAEDGADAFMLNCCSDPGLHAARESTSKAIVGPAETSMLLALALGFSFSYVASQTKPALRVRFQAKQLGIESRLVSVINIAISPPELATDETRSLAELVRAVRKASDIDGAEVVILGCTAMAPFAEKVKKLVDIPVIEPAAIAFKTAEMLVKTGLRHCRGAGHLYSVASLEDITGYQ